MKKLETVSVEDRNALKNRVSKCQRILVAQLLNARYQTLSAKLTGIQPLSKEEYGQISDVCDRLEKVLV